MNTENEKFLTMALEKTTQKLNQLQTQNILLETQLMLSNTRITELEKILEQKNDSTQF